MKKINLLLYAATILILATSIFSSVYFENHYLIRKWNIPVCPPSFLDSRQLAWASESFALGYDPLIENPVNPRGHQLNYPRIWQLLFLLGINESHTNTIGTIVVVLFFIGIGLFWFSRKFDNLTYLALFIFFLSPAVMLGIERSNPELVLFFVLSLALLANYYSSIPALSIFVFASILKLYPVFGFIYLLKEKKKRFWTLFLSASGIFILYGILSFEDFKHVYQTTPQLVNSSFGMHVWWSGLKHARVFALTLSEGQIVFFKVFTYVLALSIIITALSLGLRKSRPDHYQFGQHLDAFRVGAGIYVGCFLVMSTLDYRLIFLAFTIPQLIEWLRNKEKGFSFVPLITLLAMMLSLWNFFIIRYLGRRITFAMEEFANWVVLSTLLYLLFVSVPDWFSDFLRLPLNKSKRQPGIS